MKIHLHKNATTTPAQRAFIQNNSHFSVSQLAEKIGVSKTTVRRWRKRSNVFDHSHTPNRVSKALTPVDEIKIVLCRLVTRAGLDDLHKIVGSFLDIECSRASLNRCLKRYHISKLPGLQHFVPYDLRDYTGTYLYYICFQIPGFSGLTSPISLHTLLDCSFRIVNAKLTLSGPEFLSHYIREFPLRILGIIHQDPVVLTPGTDIGADRHRQLMMVENQCRSNRILSHHLETPYPKTIQKLKEVCASLENKMPHVFWDFPWSSNPEFAKGINQYNNRFTLGALKRKTPNQALKRHYILFPSSFRQKPETWA
ncbi:helix-turn-helix domain-containing protein [Desulfospira joergensenii]|uniref:helix-turn-helix domain-containing protein n=1 Tax=Desulfospira joergensenii TaxID=53329 RepID=UPI0003B656EE|nr:HTH domain-containing protein [Desulfospira joergensenii]